VVSGPHTPTAEFSATLQGLYAAAGSPKRDVLVRQGAGQRPPVSLNVKTLSDWFSGKSVPANPAAVRFLVSYLQPQAVKGGYQPRPPHWWLQLHERAQEERRAGREADQGAGRRTGVSRRPGRPIHGYSPFALEVHPAIEVAGGMESLPALPTYVSRMFDARLAEVVGAAASGTSHLAVLVGGSSTGKTRACWEAIQPLRGKWLLWHPIDPSRAEAAAASLTAVTPHTVVWLNEIQDYLLTTDPTLGERVAAALRTLLADPGRAPVLILGTIWPEYWDGLTSRPVPSSPDHHAQARQLLTGVDIPVPAAFTPVDLDSLHSDATGDPRLAEAFARADRGQVTQYLAGAPALLSRYHNAPPAARAMIEAAMDARRLGHGPALPDALLAAAAPGYLTDDQWDTAGNDWLDHALAYCTAPCRGACAPLTRMRPRPNKPVPRQPHYRLADFLEQHGRVTRRTVRAPAETWAALVAHATASDAMSIGYFAQRWLLYRYAVDLYRGPAAAGDKSAREQLVNLLARRGDVDELRIHTDAGDSWAAHKLTTLLADRDDTDDVVGALRSAARAGESRAAIRLFELLADRGDADGAIDVLRACADGGDGSAAHRLADLLAQRVDLDGLRDRADGGDLSAAIRLAELLAERGDVDGLRARADAGDTWAASRLAEWLVRSGDIDGLRARADAGDAAAGGHLAGLLIRNHDLDAAFDLLRRRTDIDDWAAGRLAALLVDRGDVTRAVQLLRSRADAGDRSAAHRLARLLADNGDVDGLRALADRGDRSAAIRLARLMAHHGDVDGAIELLRGHADARLQTLSRLAGDGGFGRVLANLVAFTDDVDGPLATMRVVDIDGRPTDWQIEKGNVAGQLADLLADRGDIGALRSRADAGDDHAARRLADLLAEHGDVDGAVAVLQARADAGSDSAHHRVADLLADRGDVDRLRTRADAGDIAAAWRLADLLAERHDIEGLWARVHAGDAHAGDRLADVLAAAGRPDDADRLRRYGLDPDGSIAQEPGPLRPMC